MEMAGARRPRPATWRSVPHLQPVRTLVRRSRRIVAYAALDQVVASPPRALVSSHRIADARREAAVGCHIADPKHFACAGPVFVGSLAIVTAARPYRRTVGIAADILDVGIRSSDSAVPDDVAFPDGVLRLVHPITVVLGHCGVSFRATCRKRCTGRADPSGGYVDNPAAHRYNASCTAGRDSF